MTQDMKDPIVQVSGFGVQNTFNTQTDYYLVGLTRYGRVVMSTGDGMWGDVTGNACTNTNKEGKDT